MSFVFGGVRKMSKDKKSDDTISNYYDLKTNEIDALVAALKEGKVEGEAPSYDIAETTGEDTRTLSKKKRSFDPYRRDIISTIPVPVKALFIKWWFAGMVVYFITIGLGTIISDELDRIALAGAVLGLVNELLVNPLLRAMDIGDGAYNDYMLFPFAFKQYWTFFANIIYYVLVYFCAAMTIEGINALIVLIRGIDEVTLPAEPIFMGICCLAVDMAIVGIKDFAVRLVKKSDKERKANV